MKFEMTEGCVCFSYLIDDKEFVDYTLEEQKNIVKKMIDDCNDYHYLKDAHIGLLVYDVDEEAYEIELPASNIEEEKESIKQDIDNCNDSEYLQQMFIDYLETNGKYKDLGTCEECGDTICRYTYKIK